MTLKLSPYFSDGMVLQRDKKIIIRGFANPRFPVCVNFSGKTVSAAVGADGKWSADIGSFAASAHPAQMRVVSGKEEIMIRDILIGDVWLCSGQSNMEFTLDRVKHNYPDGMNRDDTLIRQLAIPQVYNFSGAGELPDCKWETYSPHTAPNFTAVGYFFAKKLRKKLGVPIGLLACAVGGSPVAAWLSRDMLADFPELSAEADKCADSEYVDKTINDYAEYEQDYAKRLDAKDEGLDNYWYDPDFDDSDWEEAGLFDELTATGAYWFRKTIDLPLDMREKQAALFLGTAVDMDEVYVDGEKVGVTYYRYPTREYEFILPKTDKLNITVRLQGFNGKGGFTKGKNCFLATSRQTVDLGGVWKRKTGVLFNEDKKPQTFFNWKPTGLYNGMIMPLSDFAIKGVIWYQGESDGGDCERYAEKMKLLINGWRELWGHGMPFIMTQLAYWSEEGDWNPLRDKQKECLDLPNTGLAAAYDLGEENDLHPQNKRDVGERLARLALRIAYGKESPPNMFEMYNIL